MSFCLVQGQESASDVHVSFDDRPAGEGVTERDERDERDERAALTTRYKMPREPPKEKNLDVSTTPPGPPMWIWHPLALSTKKEENEDAPPTTSI